MPRPVGKAHHGHGHGPGRGHGHGHGHGHGGRKADDSRETTISKAMSFVLRHGAEKEGLKMDEAGYANVGDLVSWFF
jgi:2'-phosphotransferase